MAYCAAGCNQEPVQAIVAQVVSLYSSSNDCCTSPVQLMYSTERDLCGRVLTICLLLNLREHSTITRHIRRVHVATRWIPKGPTFCSALAEKSAFHRMILCAVRSTTSFVSRASTHIGSAPASFICSLGARRACRHCDFRCCGGAHFGRHYCCRPYPS